MPRKMKVIQRVPDEGTLRHLPLSSQAEGAASGSPPKARQGLLECQPSSGKPNLVKAADPPPISCLTAATLLNTAAETA